MFVIRFQSRDQKGTDLYVPASYVPNARPSQLGNARLFDTEAEAKKVLEPTTSWGMHLQRSAEPDTIKIVPAADADPYILVCCDEEAKFVKQVSGFVRCGFRPAGGVAVNRLKGNHGYEYTYTQALARLPGVAFPFDEA